MQQLTVSGEVTSGLGVGKIFMAKEWVRGQCLEKLGFMPYSGTFNVRIRGDASADFLQSLEGAPGIELIPEEPGFCPGRCVKVEVANQIRAAVVIPAKTEHLPEVLEIIAPLNIREALGLQDGETVEISLKR